MRLNLVTRNLAHHWRAHLAVLLGVAAGSAALTGALLVGDAVRGSLRATALARIGRIDYVTHAARPFRAQLADDLTAVPGFTDSFDLACAILAARATVNHADSGAAARRVNVYGIPSSFWRLDATTEAPGFADVSVAVNAALARELDVTPGQEVILRVRGNPAISPETLLGRRDDAPRLLRARVERIIDNAGLGALTLRPAPVAPRNVFLRIEMLQRLLRQPGQANTLLIHARGHSSDEPPTSLHARLSAHLSDAVTLEDLGLRLRANDDLGYASLETESILIPPAIETAAMTAAEEVGSPVGVLTHLANSITIQGRDAAAVPYSTVTAVRFTPAFTRTIEVRGGEPPQRLRPWDILLNDWTARELNAQVGDVVRLEYYLAGPFGRLATSHADFTVRGIVELKGGAADPAFAPTYPGVTDAKRVTDWMPPFPVDFDRIEGRDEAYWEAYRATPKAFIGLRNGQQLWTTVPPRFGRLTSLRVYPRIDADPPPAASALASAFEAVLRRNLSPAQAGLNTEPLRQQVLDASRGTTDFAHLFLGFSAFLVASAALLVVLLHQLMIERRARELGTLLALGFTPSHVRRVLLCESAVTILAGSAAGVALAGGYAWLLLAGLRSWWSAAVGLPLQSSGGSVSSYVGGYVASAVLGFCAIARPLRRLPLVAPRALLADEASARHDSPTDLLPAPKTRALVPAVLFAIAGALAASLSATARILPAATAFFAGGTCILLACLAALRYWLHAEPSRDAALVRAGTVLRLGVRNARRHAGRSLLTASLIACATFIITALQAMRMTPPADSLDPRSPTGGFTLVAESDTPLLYDLGSADGRRALALSEQAEAALRGVPVFACRLRDGDDTSCLNLYRPATPRLLGIPDSLIERGGFRFADVLATDAGVERIDPWLLLLHAFEDGAIPIIADEASARWQLHLGLGDALPLTDEAGNGVRLRLVACVRGSMLQGEVLIAERSLVSLFPSIAGHNCWMIAAPPDARDGIKRILERELASHGFAAVPVADRLAELQAVQNTYLSTFQALGGFGLLLGVLGLGAVLLRNVWERRAELALLRVLGFSHAALGALVLAENAFLVLAGLAAGLLAAAIVAAPHILERGAVVPWTSLLWMFAGIFAAGIAAGVIALLPALRGSLVPALRTE